ncbi:hypothetical protein BJX70DRAFT_395018 [Aspergillus crustosus]
MTKSLISEQTNQFEKQAKHPQIRNATTEKIELVLDHDLEDHLKQLQAALESTKKALHSLETDFNNALVENLSLRAEVLNTRGKIERVHGPKQLNRWNDELLAEPNISEDNMEVISALEESETETRWKKARGLFNGRRNLGVDMVKCVEYLMIRGDVRGIAKVMDLWSARGRGAL